MALVPVSQSQGPRAKARETCGFRRRSLAGRRVGYAATGAGEGIRTLDPDLGKVVLYP